ncbi:spore germination protein [Metabacillus idriensis]|uniref:spore germination protein n=1 Tax=Metabacillus idriensis TaxID=324768 RepID=UPI0028140F9E|nr:spore germination protein [Metabacillus idriensis]MDR0136134.1 spore germination protein [Metabacillus idriensis]
MTITDGRISSDLTLNCERIKEITGGSADMIIHQIQSFSHSNIKGIMTRIDGISDDTKVFEFTLKPLIESLAEKKQYASPEYLKELKDTIIAIDDIKMENKWENITKELLEGNTILLFDQIGFALIVGTSGGEKRPISEPTSQTVIRGPKDSFIEDIRVNTSLVRRRLKCPGLCVEKLEEGQYSHTQVELMYLKDKVNEKALESIKEKLLKKDPNIIMESAYIEKIVQNDQITPFPVINHTERPDEIVSNLYEGRIAIFIDGTPFVLYCPIEFRTFFQTTEDYFQQFSIDKFMQGLRYFAFFLSLFAPSIYIGLVTHHQAMIPNSLLLSLYAQREGIPFPSLIEALIMETTFEILREAGIRMPRAIGQAVSIVGALVIGQTAVEAGLVSTAVVIVVSITAISSFTTPNYSLATTARMLRFIFMFVSYFLGFYGLLLAMLILMGHLMSLKSLNMPYFTYKDSGKKGRKSST